MTMKIDNKPITKKLVFRILGPDDPDFKTHYLRIRNQGLGDFYLGGLATDGLDEELDRIHLMLYWKNEGKEIPVAVARGQMTEKPGIAEIFYVAVEEKYRRKHGFGSRLMSQMEKILIQKGAKTIHIPVREPALRFYEKKGYKILHEGPPLTVTKKGKTKSVRIFIMEKDF